MEFDIGMESSVLEELLAENVQLRKQISELSDTGFVSVLHILEEKPVLKVAGVLISEGVWKGIKYAYDELKKALSKFKDLPALVSHGKDETFKDRIVGRLTKVIPNDMLRSLVFEGEITDEDVARLVKEGTFNAVSLKGEFGDLEKSTVPPVGKDYTPIEWSLTNTPACPNALIFTVQELSNSLYPPVVKEEVAMSQEVKTQEVTAPKTGPVSQPVEEFEIKDTDVLVLPEEWDSLPDFSEVELEIAPLDSELAKKRKIIRVPRGRYPKIGKKVLKYYGYPYPYYAYPYYYYYGYPYYGYGYPAPKKLELDEVFETLALAQNYRDFMKTCMKEGKDMKTCASEWKAKYPEGLAKIECPVCGQEFETKDDFIKHWNDEHKEKYGEYGKVKELIRSYLESLTKPSLSEIKVSLEKAVKEGKGVDLVTELLLRSVR